MSTVVILCEGICNEVFCGVLHVGVYPAAWGAVCLTDRVVSQPPRQCMPHQMPLIGLVEPCAQSGQKPALLCSKVEKEQELQPPRSTYEAAPTPPAEAGHCQKELLVWTVSGQHTLGQPRPRLSHSRIKKNLRPQKALRACTCKPPLVPGYGTPAKNPSCCCTDTRQDTFYPALPERAACHGDCGGGLREASRSLWARGLRRLPI